MVVCNPCKPDSLVIIYYGLNELSTPKPNFLQKNIYF
nr:MAG TPA: hypothetical protein [Bacteriophage sp.]